VFRKIVNVSSISGTMGNAGQANYAAGKAAVVGMTKTLAKEWGRMRVNVNAVAYGFIRTRLTEAAANDDAKVNIDGRDIKVGINPELVKAAETQIPLGRAGTPEDAVMEVALEAGADDVIVDADGAVEVICDPASFEAVKAALEKAGFKPEVAEVTMRPENTVELSGEDGVRMQKLLDVIEDLDDVQSLYHNAEISP